MKKRLGLIVCLLFLLAVLLTDLVPAQVAEATAIKLIVDGRVLPTEVPPRLEKNRVLVPLRAVFEALGADVKWDAKAKKVVATRGKSRVELTVNKAMALRNGSPVYLEAPARIIGGRVLVPLRFVGEALGADVNWQAAAAVVNVNRRPEFISIVDTAGKETKVLSPASRVVALNRSAAEIICALGAADKLVGVADNTDFPPLLAGKTRVGDSGTPSVEKIVALKPQVVFAYRRGGGGLKPELAAQLEAAGIPVVYLDCNNLETMVADVTTLGRILGREKEAKEYAAFYQYYLDKIASRTKGLRSEQKPTVYLEFYGDYATVAGGSWGAQFIELAGGRNIAAAERVPNPRVSAEWVLAQNPQVIIRALSEDFGYGTTAETARAKRAEIMSRPGWKQITAVKQGRVYILSSEIYIRPRGIVGLAYMAKWLHPELFRDLDPEALHREMLRRFHGLDLKGSWVYPEGR